VDPVHHIDAFRTRLEAERATSFWLHVDAAWGGYIRSLFVPQEEDGIDQQIQTVNQFASRDFEICQGLYQRKIHVRWGNKEVCRAYLAFPRAESITVDPHKMGYVPYPCGVIAFRNDRIRHFLTQEAPYITVTSTDDAAASVYNHR
jgi:glutamate/tyrosine decarboxylase-like PLP-dependent enzyme